jgi:phosphatidylinositol alpha-1,6-mannosyltransferase
MKRPLFCSLSLYSAMGGIQRFNRRVLGRLIERGEEAGSLPMISVLADNPEELPRQGAEFRGFSGDRWRFALNALQRSRNADALIIDHIDLLRVAALAKLLRPSLPTLMFAHGVEVWGDPKNRRMRAYEMPMLRFAIDRVACVSRYTIDRMGRAFGYPPDRFSLLPNAVDDLGAPPSVRPAGPPTVLTVSRLDILEPYKNVDKVIRAVASLGGDIPDLRLDVVGDGTWRPALEQLASAEGLGDRVSFLGRVSDDELKAAYGRATLFALPSTKEGFGIAYLEAWQNGLPVIGSTEGAAPEVIEQGVDGILVDAENVSELAQAIARLARAPEERARLANAGAGKVRALYSGACFARNLDAILDGLSSRPGSTRG